MNPHNTNNLSYRKPRPYWDELTIVVRIDAILDALLFTACFFGAIGFLNWFGG